MAAKILALLSSVALGACSVIGIRDGTEEPHYDVIAQTGPLEIRRYAPRIAAETTVPGEQSAALSTGFRRIAGYIFGGNTTHASIAMTAPVAQSSSETIAMTAPVAQSPAADGAWTIRFFMPAKYTMETLPTPTDQQVRLVPVPSETLAVLRFTGSTGAEAVATRQVELSQALAATEWHAAGPAFAWFYDPPWTLPFLRRNEVAVAVTAKP